MQQEILVNGPIEVAFTVYSDFEAYTGVCIKQLILQLVLEHVQFFNSPRAHALASTRLQLI